MDEIKNNEEDQNEVVKNDVKKSTNSPGKTPQKEAKKTMGDNFNDIKGEFRKIIWPTKQVLAKKTATVIVTSAIIGVLVLSLDTVFALGMGYFSALVGK